MAWCMQLVVFVQPFLPGQSIPGLGVCQVIVDAFTQPNGQLGQNSTVTAQQAHHQALSTSVSKTQQHHQHALMPRQVGGPDQLTQPRYVTQSTLPLSSYPQTDHHVSHLSCGFCILYGHAIPPPDAPKVWAQVTFNTSIIIASHSHYTNNILAADYLQPKSRAPPTIYFHQT